MYPKTEIIDIIDEGIIAIDSQGYITIYNKMARDIFGITPAQGPGHPKGIIADGDLVIIADNILGADDGGMKPKDLELIGIDPTGMRGRCNYSHWSKVSLGRGIYKRWASFY